jgi:RecA-family ATPase
MGLRTVSAASFEGRPIPPREWHAHGLVPANDATQLGGDGGTGKSILAAQLAVATVLGRPWLGIEVKRGSVIYLGAEDDLDEMHRRFAAIARQQDVRFDRLADLHICCLAGQDALLATADASGNVRPTPLWLQFKTLVADVEPILIVYDTLADLLVETRTDARRPVNS